MECNFTKAGDKYELTLERTFAHPPEKVWRALTESELLNQWFPCEVTGSWEVGGDLKFRFLHGEDAGLTEEDLIGKVLTADAPNLLEFTWGKYQYKIELAAHEDGCHFLFTEINPNISEGARSAAGWEMCIENIALIINGAQIAMFAFDKFKEKFAHYSKKFEPTMGPQEGPPEGYVPPEE